MISSGIAGAQFCFAGRLFRFLQLERIQIDGACRAVRAYVTRNPEKLAHVASLIPAETSQTWGGMPASKIALNNERRRNVPEPPRICLQSAGRAD
jgi:hypothetical protein